MASRKEVVVVTGAGGFLGRHVVHQLQSESWVAEIRAVDLRVPADPLDDGALVPVHWTRADLADGSVEAEAAFAGADLVLHCAGLVDRSHPADLEALHRNNVQATEAVVSLCQRLSVPRLVVTSTAEVVLVPYLRGVLRAALGPFSLIVNQTEARAVPPDNPDDLEPYVASKLRAERVALQANGSPLRDGGALRTVALRPPLMYGEGDQGLVPPLLRLARLCDGTLLQVGGAYNRQQHAYVGNVAWAHVCAGRALALESSAESPTTTTTTAAAAPGPQSVAGLPVFVTDDSPRGDVLRLTQLLLTFPDASGVGTPSLVRVRPWPVPAWAAFLGAAAAEALLAAVASAKLPVRPTALVRYLSSFVSLSRLRAETRLRYVPKYGPEDAVARSRAYYARAKDLHGPAA